jgi:hypothetical protein
MAMMIAILFLACLVQVTQILQKSQLRVKVRRTWQPKQKTKPGRDL